MTTVLGDDTRPDRARFDLALPSVPASISGVRRMVSAACAAHGLAHLADTAALLATELATNALLHGLGQVRVRVSNGGRSLRVEVGDDNPSVPTVKQSSATDEGGRGLALVDALATAWGCDRAPGGKTMWFVLAG